MNPYWTALAGELTPYVPGEQPREQNLVKLNTNECPYGPSPLVIQAVRASGADSLRLYPDPEAVELRETLAAYHGVSPNQVFVGNGSDEVLAHAFAALLKHDQPLVFPDITYSFYPVYAKLTGVLFETVPVDEALEVRVADYRRRCGGIVLANPNAPTGIALPLAEIARLLDEHRDIPVVIDEAYIDFGGETALKLLAGRPNLLIIRTMSKSRALAGLRVGYAIGESGLIEALTRVKDSFNSYPLGRPAQAGAIASVKDELYFRETVAKVLMSRETMTKGLAELGFVIPPSSANFIFARHAALSGTDWTKRLRERKVLVRNFQKPRIADHLRISVGSDSDVERLLETCYRILHA
jgi:histidinol-phosphate aminotransferase